jgi:Fe-S cluster assembly protein SufD
MNTASTPLPEAEVEGGIRALPFLEAVEAFAKRTNAGLPLSFKGPREALLNRFLEKGIPNHKDEEWKYTSLRLLDETRFAAEAIGDPDPSLLDGLPGLGEGPRLVFWNGSFCLPLSNVASLDAKATLRTLSECLQAEQLPQGFGESARLDGRLGSTNDERFAWLNAASFEDGVFLDVAAGATLERPIQIVFLSGGALVPVLSFPRLFVRLGENAHAKIVEFHAGTGTYASFPVAEAELARASNLEHTRLQDESPHAFHLATIAVRQAEGSTYTSNSAQFGGRIARSDVHVWIGGEHCETWLNGAYVGSAEQQLDNYTRLDHAMPNCHSFEVYKGILAGRSNGVFNGKIFVYPDAQKTDAKQTNQALLLSPTATVDTKPQLEIFADDVKCTHGATIGQLREDAMFYLRSRGLPKDEARNMLVYAFAAEVLERISIEEVREAFEARLFQKLREAEQG